MSTSGDLVSYTELADVLTLLPILVRAARRARQLSLRDLGDQLGVASATVYRLEAGKGECSVATAVAVMRWLGKGTGQ